MYDDVQAEMGVESDPPAGLIFHWAGEMDGKWTALNVWESREAYDRFRKVSGRNPADEPMPTVTEFAVHHYLKP